MTGDQLKTYYERLKKYFKSDIQALIHADDHKENVGCGPYLLVTCSAVDFLGNLHHDKSEIKNQSSEGFKHYILKFLSKINPVYGLPDVPELIYNIIRCGQVHEAIVKPGVYIGKRNKKDEHLKYLSISLEKSKMIAPKWIYFDVRIFAEDFLNSLPYFEESFNSKTELERMAKKLQTHLEKIKKRLQKINPKIDILKIDPSNFAELYNTTSSTPYIEGGAYLKEEYLDIIAGE